MPRTIIGAPREDIAVSSAHGMDLTNCTNQGSVRNSERFSVGMDLTEVIRTTMNDSGESSMDLTKYGQSQPYRPFMCQNDVNISDGMSGDSDALDFTDAIIDPRFSVASTRYSVSNMDMTRNLYSVNHTRYSVNAMDLTKMSMSPSSSGGRKSSRYSLSNMELTEVVGNDCSGLEFTEVISEPKIVSTRYSVNDMDFTEAITNNDLTGLTPKTIEYTCMSRDKLDCSVASTPSIDLVKPIFEIQQSSIVQNTMDHVKTVRRPSTCSSTNMDSLEYDDSTNETEDTPTTQTYNGIPEAIKTENGDRELVLQEEKNKLQISIDDGKFEVHQFMSSNIVGILPDELHKPQSITESSGVQLAYSVSDVSKNTQHLNSDHTQKENITVNLETSIPTHSEEADEVCVTKSNCNNSLDYNIMELKIHSTNRDEKENISCTPAIENEVMLKTDEKLGKEHITLVNHENMDLSEPPVLSHSPITKTKLGSVVDNIENNESENESLEMDISISSPAKSMSDTNCLIINAPINQVKFSDTEVVERSLSPPQLMLNNDDIMKASFTESNLVKEDEGCVIERQNNSSLSCRDNFSKFTEENHCSQLEINQKPVETKNVETQIKLEHVAPENMHNNEQFDDKSFRGGAEDSVKQSECSLINLSHSGDLNVSTNNTPFGKNITMTRGGTSRHSIIPPDNSIFETSKEDSIRNIYDQTSELESSVPLIQRMENLKKTDDNTEVYLNESQDKNLLTRKEKGKFFSLFNKAILFSVGSR